MSPSRTGPFTFLMIWRLVSPRNSTFTWVHWPWDPVRPRTFITRAKTLGLSILYYRYRAKEKLHTCCATSVYEKERWQIIYICNDFVAQIFKGWISAANVNIKFGKYFEWNSNTYTGLRYFYLALFI